MRTIVKKYSCLFGCRITQPNTKKTQRLLGPFLSTLNQVVLDALSAYGQDIRHQLYQAVSSPFFQCKPMHMPSNLCPLLKYDNEIFDYKSPSSW